MSTITKLPKIVPWSKQKCPLCNEDKLVIALGMSISLEKEEVSYFPDMGYSFCNCKSIWFTDWSNIRPTVFEDNQKQHSNKHYRKLVADPLRYYIIKKKLFNMGYKKNKFLDLGSVTPYLLDEAKRLGWETMGWDKWKRDNFSHPLIVGDFEEMELDNKFDLIWSSHFFEHLHYPIKALQKCYKMLDPKGIMFVAMPDPYFVQFDNAYACKHWTLREHHIIWDMDSFCDELETIGFKVLMKERNTVVRLEKDYHIICQK